MDGCYLNATLVEKLRKTLRSAGQAIAVPLNDRSRRELRRRRRRRAGVRTDTGDEEEEKDQASREDASNCF